MSKQLRKLATSGLMVNGETFGLPDIADRSHRPPRWPTPSYHDGRGGWAGARTVTRAEAVARGDRHQTASGASTQVTLSIQVLAEELASGADRQDVLDSRLNPEFVEFLMGFPRGWTEA